MIVVSRSAVATAFLAFAPFIAGAQAVPKAEEIFARSLTAIGGKEAVMKVSSMKTVGTMQMVSMGITANVETISAAPDLLTTRLIVPGIGEMISGFDGSVAWELNPLKGARIKTEQETIEAQEAADFYHGILYQTDRYLSYETVGAADFGGEKTWQVKTVLKSGRVVNEYFSVATGLRVGSQSKLESAKGAIEIVTVVSDYKQFGGIKLATRNEMTTGPSKMLATIVNVEWDAVPPGAFAPPEAIRALIGRP